MENLSSVEPTPEEMQRVMASLGRRKSERKAATSQANGKEGGRPMKPLSEILCNCGAGDSLEHKAGCLRGKAIRRRIAAGLIKIPTEGANL